MKKGFVRMLEVFLTIQLLAIFLSTMQVSIRPGHYNPYDMERLTDNAESISQSLCNNVKARRTIINNGSLENIGLNPYIPKDLNYSIKIYNGTYFSNFVDETSEIPNKNAVGTGSCMIMEGHKTGSIELDEPINCSSPSQLSKINRSDGERLALSSGTSLEIRFSSSKDYRNTLIIEGYQTSGSGNTDVKIANESGLVTVTESKLPDEPIDGFKEIDLTYTLPDYNGEYNVTIEPDVRTFYDSILLRKNRLDTLYDSYKLSVGVWNK